MRRINFHAQVAFPVVALLALAGRPAHVRAAAAGTDEVLCGTVGGTDYLEINRTDLTRVCVARAQLDAHGDAYPPFFEYFDQAVTKLSEVFGTTPAGLPWTVQITTPTGGAHTGTNFGTGVTVTGDAYYNVSRNPVTGEEIPGFYGYLLTLHEMVNVTTGQVSGGWPTDWWADHRSPFPNAMDAELMRDIGQDTSNYTLLAAATYQFTRFADPNRSGYDPQVAMFMGFRREFGSRGFANAFSLVRGDGLRWGTVAPNPSPLLTNYVIAYLQLGFETTDDLVQSRFIAARVSQLDPRTPPYSPDSDAVAAIANAHCTIQAAGGAGDDVSDALTALQHGDYQDALVPAPYPATCPHECAFDRTIDQCVAGWVAGK